MYPDFNLASRQHSNYSPSKLFFSVRSANFFFSQQYSRDSLKPKLNSFLVLVYIYLAYTYIIDLHLKIPWLRNEIRAFSFRRNREVRPISRIIEFVFNRTSGSVLRRYFIRILPRYCKQISVRFYVSPYKSLSFGDLVD